jgi:hypothetical protein
VGIHWDTPLNINLNINNEKQDCKISTVCGRVLVGRGSEGRRLRWQYIIDGLYETELKKPLAIAWDGLGRGLRGRDDGRKINNVQYKSDWNCHFEPPPPNNEYILIKKKNSWKDLLKLLMKDAKWKINYCTQICLSFNSCLIMLVTFLLFKNIKFSSFGGCAP